MTGERQETGPWTTKTQHRDGTLINNILITFVPALSGTTIIYWEPACWPGRGGRGVMPLFIFWFICQCYCWTGEEAPGRCEPGAGSLQPAWARANFLKYWLKAACHVCHGWLSTIVTKFIKNIFCGKSIMRKIIKLTRPGCEDSSVLCSGWITESQSEPGASVKNVTTSSPHPAPVWGEDPPALQQLMHHNLNNNYVQYNFWWSKLTKTSLYQEIFVPTNKKVWPEFANLASFCKMLRL